MAVPLPNGLFWLIKWGDPNHVSKSWDGVDGSDDFPDFNWVISRYKMLSFRNGIGRKSNVILVATGQVDKPNKIQNDRQNFRICFCRFDTFWPDLNKPFPLLDVHLFLNDFNMELGCCWGGWDEVCFTNTWCKSCFSGHSPEKKYDYGHYIVHLDNEHSNYMTTLQATWPNHWSLTSRHWWKAARGKKTQTQTVPIYPLL